MRYLSAIVSKVILLITLLLMIDNLPDKYISFSIQYYSTVTDLAKFLG